MTLRIDHYKHLRRWSRVIRLYIGNRVYRLDIIPRPVNWPWRVKFHGRVA